MKIIKVSSLAGATEALPSGGNFDGVYYFDAAFAYLEQIVSKHQTILHNHFFVGNYLLY